MLRVIAALLVAVLHVIPSSAELAVSSVPFVGILDFVVWRALDIGRLGVFIFFIINGYCIAGSIGKYKYNNVSNFVLSRFFRFYPAYWVSLIFAHLIYGDSFSGVMYALNFSMMQFFAGERDVIGVYWALAVEIVLYCVYRGESIVGSSWYRDSATAVAAIGMFLFFSYAYRLKSPALVFLGSISFSIYLLHPLVLSLLTRDFGDLLQAVGPLRGVVIYIVLAILAASAVFHAVETLLINVEKRLIQLNWLRVLAPPHETES